MTRSSSPKPRPAAGAGVLLGFALLGACQAERIKTLECAADSDCAENGWCSSDHLCVTRVQLVPDAQGLVDASSNLLGVQGRFRASADGYGPAGLRDGRCQGNGHPDAQCSRLSAPDPSLGVFPNEAGLLCTSGIAARALPGDVGPDFWGMWGAEIEFEFTDAQGSNVPFNALEAGVRGFSFEIDDAPIPAMRLEFVTPGKEASEAGPEYWGGGPMYPRSPVVAGTNSVPLDLVRSPNLSLSLDATQIQTVRFHIPSVPEQDSAFAYCISNLAVLSKGDPVFDQVDPNAPPSAILIDNFDDLDMNPLDPRFSAWGFGVYNTHPDTGSQVATIWVDAQAALNSQGGMHFEWSMEDKLDGAPENLGAVLVAPVSVADVYLDLSRYSRLVMAHRLVPVDARVPGRGPDCVPLQQLRLDFACGEFGTSYVVGVPVTSGYTTSVVPFSDLTENTWDATGTTLVECLSRIEAIGFHVQPPVQDGQCTTGHLFLDSISIR